MSKETTDQSLREEILAKCSVVGLDNGGDGEPDLWQFSDIQAIMQIIDRHVQAADTAARIDEVKHMPHQATPDEHRFAGPALVSCNCYKARRLKILQAKPTDSDTDVSIKSQPEKLPIYSDAIMRKDGD